MAAAGCFCNITTALPLCYLLRYLYAIAMLPICRLLRYLCVTYVLPLCYLICCIHVTHMLPLRCLYVTYVSPTTLPLCYPYVTAILHQCGANVAVSLVTSSSSTAIVAATACNIQFTCNPHLCKCPPLHGGYAGKNAANPPIIKLHLPP